jgi:hypothetical protein
VYADSTSHHSTLYPLVSLQSVAVQENNETTMKIQEY